VTKPRKKSAKAGKQLVVAARRGSITPARQFFDAYEGEKKVSPLVTQLPWTHHLILLSQTKHSEERGFYMLAAIKGRWTKRELERQILTDAALRSSSSSSCGMATPDAGRRIPDDVAHEGTASPEAPRALRRPRNNRTADVGRS